MDVTAAVVALMMVKELVSTQSLIVATEYSIELRYSDPIGSVLYSSRHGRICAWTQSPVGSPDNRFFGTFQPIQE